MGIAHRDRLKETQSRFVSVIKASDFAKGLTAQEREARSVSWCR